MIQEISLAGGTRTPTGKYWGSRTEVPAQTLRNVPNHTAEHRAGHFEQELMLRLRGSKRNALNRMETAIPCDLPAFEEKDDGPDPTLREIRLRAAKVRAGWTERERRSRLAYRTQRMALQFIRFIQLISQRTMEEGTN